MNIYAKLNSQAVTQLGFPIWSESLSNKVLSGWQIAQVSLGHGITNTPFQVVFEEFVEGGKTGKIIFQIFNLRFRLFIKTIE